MRPRRVPQKRREFSFRAGLGPPVERDAAIGEPDDPVGEAARMGHVVRDEDQRQALVVGQAEQQFHDLAPGARIERGVGLVGQHEFRPLHQHARDGDALGLAARERIGALHRLVGEPDGLQAGHRVLANGRRSQRLRPCARPGAARLHAMDDIAERAEAGDEVVLLEDDADARAKALEPCAPQPTNLLAENGDPAGISLGESHDDAQQSRFAGAVGPDQRERLA